MASIATPAVFSFQSTAVRTFADDSGEPWFSANDVCKVLGYINPRDAVIKHCRDKGVAKRDTLTERGQQEMTFINEGNLYRLIIKSRKPEAEKFEAWVMEEVLPAIRKTGQYTAPAARIDARMTPDEYLELLTRHGKTIIDAEIIKTITTAARQLEHPHPAPTSGGATAHFAADWREQRIPVPYTACKRRELYRAYMCWCNGRDIAPRRDRVFYAELLRAVPRMESLIIKVDGKSARCAVPPGTRTGIISGTWMTHADIEISRFGAALRAWEDIE